MARRSQNDLEAHASRAGEGTSWFIQDRLGALSRNLEAEGWPLAYFPLAICATLETFFRNWLKDLSRRGEPYLTRLKPKMRDIRIDYEHLIGLGDRRISLEDIISSSIAFGGAQGAIETAGSLFNCDFRKSMLLVREQWFMPEGHQGDFIIKDPSQVFPVLEECFRNRHVLAHELPVEAPCSRSDVERYLEVAMLFVSAFDAAAMALVNPDAPTTQQEMNFQAHDNLSHLWDEVASLTNEYIEKIKNHREDMVPHLKREIKSWEVFIHRHARFQASEAEGGSIAPLIYAHALEALLKERIINLRQYIRLVRQQRDYWWQTG